MVREYDYIEQQMDEHVLIMPIPITNPHSLNSSRRHNDQQNPHKKVLMDLEQFIKSSKQKQSDKVLEMKKRQKNMSQQITRRQFIKQSKIKQLEKEQKQRMLKQCTFKPTLHNKDKNQKKRNFQEFLESQEAHTQKINQKKQYMKQCLEKNKQKGTTYRPKINSSANKRKSSRQNNGNTVYDRLYALRDKQNIALNSQCQNNQQKFHPTINQRSKNMVRNGPIDQLLYSDALRRQQKGSQIIMTSSSIAGSKIQKSSNFNNEKYAAQKFIRQFFFILEDLKIETSLSATVQYVVFNQLLKQMGFMTNQQEYETKSSSYERSLMHDAYEILQKYQVNARNICVFLLALLGIYHINPVNFEEGEQPDESKELNFDEIQGRKIQKHFDLFYRNRLSSQMARRNEERAEQHTFQPKINKQSAALAEKHRNNMLQEANQLIDQYPQIDFAIPEDGVISHTDLLVLHKMAKDIEKQRIKYDRQAEQMKLCTFKPNTFNSSLSNSKMSENLATGMAGYKKSHQLYQYHKNIINKKQSMKASRSDIDPQCTFKPQINKHRIPLQSPGPASKQTDQTLYRLFKGRHDHQQKKKFLERGQLSQKQKTQKNTTQQDQRVPSLILDVNLGQKVDRIVLYKGDQQRLQEVAMQFAQKHGIDEQSQVKLLEMLKSEMENILSKIDQDQQSQQGDM